MAAKSAIAMRANAAIERIEQLLGEGFTLPTQGRDADMVHAQQLEAIADFLEAHRQPEPTALEHMRGLDIQRIQRGLGPLDVGVDMAEGEDRTVMTQPKRKAKRNANANG